MSDNENKLYPEDQAKVDAYIKRGYNDIERRPFRPLLLLLVLFIVVSALGGGAYLIAYMNGVI